MSTNAQQLLIDRVDPELVERLGLREEKRARIVGQDGCEHVEQARLVTDWQSVEGCAG